jgi:hypothetical protein
VVLVRLGALVPDWHGSGPDRPTADGAVFARAADQARFLLAADPCSVYCHEFSPQESWYAGNAAAACTFEFPSGAVRSAGSAVPRVGSPIRAAS